MSVLLHPGILQIKYAQLIIKPATTMRIHVAMFEWPLYQRKNVILSDDISSAMWPRLKKFVLKQNPFSCAVITSLMCYMNVVYVL